MLQAALMQAVNRNQAYHNDDSMFGAAAALDGSGISNAAGSTHEGRKSSSSTANFNMPRKPLIGGSALPSNSIPGGVDGSDLFIRWVGRGRPMTAPPKDIEIGPSETSKPTHSYIGHGPSGTIDTGNHSGLLDHHTELDNQLSSRSRPSSNAGYRSQDYAAAASASRSSGTEYKSTADTHESALETARTSTPGGAQGDSHHFHSHVFGAGLEGGGSSSRTASHKAPFSTNSRAGSAARSHPQPVAQVHQGTQGMPPIHSSTKVVAVDASMDSSVLFVYTGAQSQLQPQHKQTPARQSVSGTALTSIDLDRNERNERSISKNVRQSHDENQQGVFRAPVLDSSQSSKHHLQSPAAEAAAILHASGLHTSMTDYYQTISKDDHITRNLDGEGLPQRFGEVPHGHKQEQIVQHDHQDHSSFLNEQQGHEHHELYQQKKIEKEVVDPSHLSQQMNEHQPNELHMFKALPQSNEVTTRRESSTRAFERSESRTDSVSSNRSSPPLPRNSQVITSNNMISDSYSEGTKQIAQQTHLDPVLSSIQSPISKSILSPTGVPGSPPGSVRIRPTSAAIVRVGSARPHSSSSNASTSAAVQSASRPSSVISVAQQQQSSFSRDAAISRSSPNSISMAEIQAALNNRGVSSSESPFSGEINEKESTNNPPNETNTVSNIGSLSLLTVIPQQTVQQERINSSPSLGLAQIPDVDDDEKEDIEVPPPPPPPQMVDINPLSPSATLTSGPLDSSIDSLLGGRTSSRRASIASKYERSQTHGLTPEEVTRQKAALLAFYLEHAPKRATTERVEENFELFGPRVWQELRMKYGTDKVDPFEPRSVAE
jgi:hypothetical protein